MQPARSSGAGIRGSGKSLFVARICVRSVLAHLSVLGITGESAAAWKRVHESREGDERVGTEFKDSDYPLEEILPFARVCAQLLSKELPPDVDAGSRTSVANAFREKLMQLPAALLNREGETSLLCPNHACPPPLPPLAAPLTCVFIYFVARLLHSPRTAHHILSTLWLHISCPSLIRRPSRPLRSESLLGTGRGGGAITHVAPGMATVLLPLPVLPVVVPPARKGSKAAPAPAEHASSMPSASGNSATTSSRISALPLALPPAPSTRPSETSDVRYVSVPFAQFQFITSSFSWRWHLIVLPSRFCILSFLRLLPLPCRPHCGTQRAPT